MPNVSKPLILLAMLSWHCLSIPTTCKWEKIPVHLTARELLGICLKKVIINVKDN